MRLQPIVHERGLHLGDDRVFSAVMAVAPTIRLEAVTTPFIGDSNTTGEADSPVDDKDFAMRAIVEA